MSTDALQLLPDMGLFVAVGRAKSFSQAARTLGVPVSKVSRRIAQLEERVGVQLFRRSTRRVELTDAGRRYYERCIDIIEAAESAHGELQANREAAGHLRVSATADFASTYIVPLLPEFARRYPEITLDLDLTPRAVDLVAENFDLAIRTGKLSDTQLISRTLGWATWGIYASPDYLGRATELVRPADLAQHTCVRLRGRQGAPSTWHLRHGEATADVTVSGRFTANNLRVLSQLAVAGIGVVLLDERLAEPCVASGTLVRVLNGWAPPSVVIHALTPSRLIPTRTRIFLDCLTHHIEGLSSSRQR